MPKKQYVTSYGWLSEDGVFDYQAVAMAANAFYRAPLLTYREGLLAVFLMTRQGTSQAQISRRLNVPKSRVWEMIKKINSNLDEYESLLREKSSRTSQ